MNFIFADFMDSKFINVDFKTGCYNWLRYKNQGYGRKSYQGRLRLVHRLSKYLFGHMTHDEFINPKKVVMHLCDNPSCINPHHLKIGTQFENIKDRVKKGRCRKI